MQRMNLSWYGREAGPATVSMTFRICVVIMAAYLATDYLLAIIETALLPDANSSSSNGAYDPYHTNTNNPAGDIPAAFYPFYFLRICLHVAMLFYMVVATMNTRRYIRNKYAIPEQSCQGAEDCW